MAIQSSGTITFTDLVTEFGGTTPHALSEYYRGGALVPDITANANVPTSGAIKLSDFYGAEASVDVTPDAVNWTDVTGTVQGSTNAQTITGISTSITIAATVTGGASISANVAGNPTSLPASVSNNQQVTFTLFGSNISGSVTVINQSDGNATLDTFNYGLDGF